MRLVYLLNVLSLSLSQLWDYLLLVCLTGLEMEYLYSGMKIYYYFRNAGVLCEDERSRRSGGYDWSFWDTSECVPDVSFSSENCISEKSLFLSRTRRIMLL